MEALEPYPSLALALLTGLLIGLEREQSKPPESERRGFTGGVRTFPLFALVGGLTGLLLERHGPLPMFAAALGLSVLLAVGYWNDVQHGRAGLTSEASGLLTFFLGVLSTSHGVIEPLRMRVFVVASIAVAATVLLSQKAELRQFSAKVSRDDVLATLKFLVIALVVLPLLPNEPMGPYGALNPYRIGFMVLLIAGIGFVGYLAMRLFGHGKGVLITGAIGGVVSSTAVTLASAARAKQTPALAAVSSLAVVIAGTIMYVRVLITVAAIERSLVPRLAAPLVAMSVVSGAAAAVMAFRDRAHRAEETHVELTNPFELRKAIQFGAFFVFILVASRWATDVLGDTGTYLSGVLAGATDVDAITLSMTQLAKSGGVPEGVATRTIVIAVASNTVVKAAMSVALGGWAFARRIVEVSAVSLVVGVGLAWLL